VLTLTLTHLQVPIPFYYVEISQLLLKDAKEDFTSPEETRSLIEDLFNLRMDRLRLGE